MVEEKQEEGRIPPHPPLLGKIGLKVFELTSILFIMVVFDLRLMAVLRTFQVSLTFP